MVTNKKDNEENLYFSLSCFVYLQAGMFLRLRELEMSFDIIEIKKNLKKVQLN